MAGLGGVAGGVEPTNMDADQYGLSVASNLQALSSNVLMGFREARAERDQSLREKAYEAEQKKEEVLFPLKVAEIESQNVFRKAQAEDMLRKSNLQNSLIEVQSAISPVATEMSFLARVDSDKLRNYQIPDLSFENQDEKMAAYSKAAARKELEVLKQSLLDQDDEYQEVEQIVDIARAYSRDPTEPSPLKAGIREMIPALRQNGFRGLNEFQTQKLLPLLDRYSVMRSSSYQKNVRDREASVRKDRELDIKEMGARGKIADGLMTSDDVKEANEPGFISILGGKNAGAGSSQESSPKSDADFKIRIKQAAQSIRDGANAKDVIDELTKIAVQKGQIKNSPGEISKFKLRVQSQFQGAGLGVPDFYSPQNILSGEDLTPSEE